MYLGLVIIVHRQKYLLYHLPFRSDNGNNIPVTACNSNILSLEVKLLSNNSMFFVNSEPPFQYTLGNNQ